MRRSAESPTVGRGSFLGKEILSDVQNVGKGTAWLGSVNAWEGRAAEGRKGEAGGGKGRKRIEGWRGRAGEMGRERESHKAIAPMSTSDCLDEKQGWSMRTTSLTDRSCPG